MPDVLDATEAAAYLKISYWTVVTRAKKGLIPCFKIGKRVLFRTASLDEWMQNQEQARIPKPEKIKRIG